MRLIRLIMRLLKFLILFLSPFFLHAQDITGVWTGYILTLDNKLLYEVVISEEEKKLSGYALTVFMVNDIENQGIKSIVLKQKNGSYLIEDDELVFNNYTTPPQRVKLTGILSLEASDTAMILSGSFTTRSLDRRAMNQQPYSGTIYLRKQEAGKTTTLTARLNQLRLLNSLSFMQKKALTKDDRNLAVNRNKTERIPTVDTLKKEPASGTLTDPNASVQKTMEPEESYTGILLAPRGKAFTLSFRMISATPSKISPAMARIKRVVTKLPPPPMIEPVAAAELTQRKTEVIRAIPFTADSLVFTLYDNGTVDGDTVSVVLNGNVILPRQGLTTNAIRLVIPISPEQSDSLVLVMYAENLGSIPPNTGLLIIQDGAERHEVRFAGDMQKSSAVVLRRKKGF